MATDLCPHRPLCPGCPRFGAAGLSGRAEARLGAFARESGVPLESFSGPRREFRVRARLSTRGRAGSAKIGLFQEGTHRVADIPTCPIHHPLINRVAGEVKAALRVTKSPTYSDIAHAGLVRGIQVVVETTTQTAQLVVVANSSEPEPTGPLLEELGRRLGEQLHSLWWNGNPERTNRVLGDRWHLQQGEPWVVEPIGGAWAHFPPGAFGQSNLEAAKRAVTQVQEWVLPGDAVLELYGGVGALSLGLLKRGHRVAVNELSVPSLDGLRAGLSRLSLPEQQRAQVVPGPAAQAAQEMSSDQVVLVDPPRKGLDEEVLAALCTRRPKRLIYLSCDVDSFLRDAVQIVSAGFRLSALQAHDFFPFTYHVETLARLDRNPDRSR